ncbi:MAG TPA: VIT domain-containing protein, partial [Planctomycetota bacterium]|nr:VIT domain-containing protein [Planctomycetota bacterium]
RRFVEEARSLYGERRANVSLLRYGSLSAAACVIAAVVGWIAFRVDPQPTGPVVAPLPTEDRSEESAVAIAEIDGTRDDQLTGRGAADAEGQDIVAAATHAALGADVELYSEVRAGTRLIADEGAQWEWRGDRDLALLAGRIYLDVEPGETPFEIRHPDGRVEVLGTRLVVDAQDAGLRVDLGSGKAVLANDRGSVPLEPGEEGVLTPDAAPEKHGARRFSHVASFAAPYIESAEKELGGEESFVPGTAKRPGTERTFELEVVRYHLDIHIEDGFARTTIDQIFRNPSNERVEGTFLFPLPPDASISRLAMYVNGKLMEGGMSERGRAVEVYEGIVRKMLDPAILEWMEGSTFRLRV